MLSTRFIEPLRHEYLRSSRKKEKEFDGKEVSDPRCRPYATRSHLRSTLRSLEMG